MRTPTRTLTGLVAALVAVPLALAALQAQAARSAARGEPASGYAALLGMLLFSALWARTRRRSA